MAHADRGHARWSASASERNFACPGALALIETMGIEDVESVAAAWGTACHQIAEECLRRGTDAAEFIGGLQETKQHKFVVDEEMAECTQVFLDYVREKLELYTDQFHGQVVGELLIEQNFDLDPIDPPIQAGGTGDAVLLFPAWGLIEIVDLKTGKGWVEARGNKQLRTYALGAAIANPGPWQRVQSTIVQPRVGNTPVRFEQIDIADLLDWTQDLKRAMEKCEGSIIATVWHDPRASEEWAAQHLVAGDHCHATFCPAIGRCPAIEARALAEAQTFFTTANEIAPPPDPKSLPVDKIVGILDAADMIEAFLNGVRQYARELVEAGQELGRGDVQYILVDKQARRKWIVEDEVELLRKLAKATGLSREDFVEEKVKSPAQAEAHVKATNHITKEQAAALIADLCPAKSSGTNLVRSDKTTRAPALSLAQQFFQPETE